MPHLRMLEPEPHDRSCRVPDASGVVYGPSHANRQEAAEVHGLHTVFVPCGTYRGNQWGPLGSQAGTGMSSDSNNESR